MAAEKLTTHAVILAGGRGTRFWPRSRTRTPKQLLNIVGEDTMLEQTVARLRPLVPPERIWTVTNREQAAGVAQTSSAAGASARTDRAHRPQHRRRDRAGCDSRAPCRARRCVDGRAARRSLHRESRTLSRHRESRAGNGRAIRRRWWCSAFRRRGPKPDSATSNAPETRSMRKASPFMRCAGSRKNPHSLWRKNMPALGSITGTPGCFSGASRRFLTI